MPSLSEPTMRFISLAFAFCVMLSSNMAFALTKSSIHYDVERAWFDSDYIYIIYQKKSLTSHYSLKDIHGTVLKEKNELFLSRLAREAGEGSIVFNLESREEAKSIIYLDKEFDISPVGDGIRLSGGKNSVTLPDCMGTIWFPRDSIRQKVIRVGDQLLFCGEFFDRSGNLVLQIPKTITHVFEKDYQEHPGMLLFPLIVLSAISNGNFLIVRADPVGPITELKVGVWPLNSDMEMKWVKHVLPNSPEGYQIDTYRAYSPAGFVLRPVEAGDKTVLLCNEVRCERIGIQDEYSVLIIDETRRKSIEISNRGLPSITVHTSNY